MYDDFDYDRFFAALPRLLRKKEFRRSFEHDLDDIAEEVITAIEIGEEVPEEYLDFVCDAARNAFGSVATNYLCLEWDGGFPGLAGAVWVSGIKGVYIVSSSDYPDQGPFRSLKEALRCGCFGVTTANPEISSDELPLEKLLEIAAGVVDWENEGKIWINSEKYFARSGKLVREKTK